MTGVPVAHRARRGPRACVLAVVTATAVCAWPPVPAAAQSALHDPWSEVHAGSEIERYLRTLQVLGLAGEQAWSLRGFSPRELERVAPPEGTQHPWGGRYDLRPIAAAAGALRPSPLRVSSVANTTFAYGVNDGALWAGRGLTLAIEGGLLRRAGPLTVSLQPKVFWTQNASFPVIAPLTPIDAPERFGNDPYARLDLGETFLRLDLPAVSLGLSTAGMVWGPAERYPLVLGTNAPGFVHGFVGTGDPANIGIGRLQTRIVWGRVEESDWAPIHEFSGPGFFSAAVLTLEPDWPSGLEIGGARLFHLPWRSQGPTVRDFLRPFESLTKIHIGLEGDSVASNAENQVASAFFRWVFPEAGIEIYGEFYRDDHAIDLRNLLVIPDHTLSTNLGLRKAWTRGGNGVSVLEVEVLDAKLNHLEPSAPQSQPYAHHLLFQGHTHRGQFLGSPAAFGGEGLAITLDQYDPGGRRTFRLERTLRRDVRDPYVPDDVERTRDVAYSLTAEALSFRGAWEWMGEVTGVWNLNRNLGGDRWNLRVALQGAWRPARR